MMEAGSKKTTKYLVMLMLLEYGKEISSTVFCNTGLDARKTGRKEPPPNTLENLHVRFFWVTGRNDGAVQRRVGAAEKLHRACRRRGQSAKRVAQQKAASQPAFL